jgi:RHS repeat-associated protein
MGAAEAAVTQGELYYVHNDHLGTPQVMTDRGGRIVWRATYDPFGMADVDAASTLEMNVRFPGQYFDFETRLHYNMNRYLDVNVGRYLTSDPIGLRSSNNTYAYVDNQPINWFDLYGLFKNCSYWGGTNCREVAVPRMLPNGNFREGFTDQDFVCSGPGAFIQNLFSNGRNGQCLLGCCVEHDSCYEFHGCNESSWKGNIFGYDKPCQKCNSDAKSCFLKSRKKEDCGC